MGSKTIILLGVLLSALYLYFCVSKYRGGVTDIQNEIKVSESVEQISNLTKVETLTDTGVASAIPEEDVEVQNANERISIPAFGFMAGAKKNQIVALMSNNDENGTLTKKIETLCQKMECSKDIRFENDIIDASWQEEVVKIIDLLTDGKIESGSLFIEGNVLKLEGTIDNQETQDAVNSILNSLKSDTFKVENYLKLSANATVKKSEIEKEETTKNVEVVEVKEVKAKVIPEQTPVATPAKSTAPKVVEKPISKAKKTVKKSVEKKVVKVKTISKPEVVPSAVMKTTLDAETRVRNILSEIKDSQKETGVVANPYMQTTLENKE